MIQRRLILPVNEKTPKWISIHQLLSVNNTRETEPGKILIHKQRFDLKINAKNKLQRIRFTNSGCASSFLDSNGWQFYKEKEILTFISLGDGQDQKKNKGARFRLSKTSFGGGGSATKGFRVNNK
jgi:hypothetical protein